MKVKPQTQTWFLLLCCLFAFGVSCGDNSLQQYEDEDASQDAASQLEQGDPDKAIDILEEALESDPNDYVLVSLLSAAYAQRGGVSMIDLVLNFATSTTNESDDTAQNDMAALWPYLPEASASNINDVAEAVTILSGIPDASKTDSDFFKLAVLSVASVSMQLKALDLDGDGELSLAELANLTEASASAILSGLTGAISAVAGISGSLGEGTDEATEKVSTLASGVSNSDGDTDAEKIQNYFADET